MKHPFTIYDLRFAICRKSPESSAFNHQSSIVNHKFCRAFTLIEMLAVLAILGIIAALTVPALKNFGRSDAMNAADQQIQAAVARARQLAMSQRTTVYMVFVPTNFWMYANPYSRTVGAFPNDWWSRLTAAQRAAVTNLCGYQLTGYTFVSLSAVGDQPGQHEPHYLAPWQALPDGTFIPLQKFAGPTIAVTDPSSGVTYPIAPFSYTNSIPFPTEDTSASPLPWLPYIAFNYLGQLTTNGVDMAAAHEYIPLARGSAAPAINPDTRTYRLDSPRIAMQGTTNMLEWMTAYNIIDIDPLTGRATLHTPKVQ